MLHLQKAVKYSLSSKIATFSYVREHFYATNRLPYNLQSFGVYIEISCFVMSYCLKPSFSGKLAVMKLLVNVNDP